MSFDVSVQSWFSAAHRLRGYKGRCENMHGHNWKVQVSAGNRNLNKQGMVLDFADLKTALNKVLEGLDHKVLNDISYFKRVNPTSENIAKYIYDKLLKRCQAPKKVPGTFLHRLSTISVWETENSWASYSPNK